jgi:hypothetical protein
VDKCKGFGFEQNGSALICNIFKFDGICGSCGLSPFWVLEDREDGEELVQVIAQAFDSLGIFAFHLSANLRAALLALTRFLAYMILCRSCLTVSQSAFFTLSRTLRFLCAQHLCSGLLGNTVSMAARQPLPPSTPKYFKAVFGKAPFVKIGEEGFPSFLALAQGQPEVYDLLLAIPSDAKRHQHRALHRPGPGLSG